ncbi:MAG: hypothetical protein C0490_09060 [Marivirga sp.]|nr:hypothetical protein [Marivirga sp.]
MKKIPPQLEDKVLLFIDGELNTAEIQEMEAELRVNDALRIRYDELRTLHSSLKSVPIDHPSKNFTQVVMGKLDHYPRTSANFSIRSILLLAGVLVAVGIAAILVSAGVFDGASTTIDLNEIELSKKYIDKSLPLIPLNGKLIVNIIILLNLGLAWLVLDRAILKPLFQRRLQSGH